MAIDKDFVVKNGLQVNENLIFADSDNDKVGLGTTTPNRKLVVIGNAEVSSDLAVGTTITAQRGAFTGIITANDGIDVGVGGTFVSIDKLDAKIGIGSTSPVYTLDLYGPVSTGTTAAYIFGDVEVTGTIKGNRLEGQISAGGTVGFTNVTVDNVLDANNAEVYTKFNIEEVTSDTFRFLVAGDPPGIGFTQNTDNPEIYVSRGQKYEFHLDSGGFPFYLKTQPTADLNNQYSDGVTNNGAQVGVVTFKVPFNSPNILYYQASNVAGMGGTIYVDNDNKTYTVGVLTVSQFLDSDTQADFEQIYVSGIGTINNLKGPDFSVSSGILTVRQDQTALIGVSTGADRVSLQEKSDNVAYQVPFSDTLGIGSNYQNLYVDSEDGQMSYNPSTNRLTVNRVIGNLSGIATGADNINIDSSSANTKFQVTFSNPGSADYQRQLIDSDSDRLTYNPSTNTLSSTNITATTVTAGLAGTATNADNINVDKKSNNTTYQVLFSDNQGAGYQRPYIDSQSGQFTYNPSTNTLTAANIAGAGDNLTNLDGSNISQGTINADRIPDASTTAQGVVQLYDTFPPNSSSTTRAATANLVTDVYDEVRTAVIPAGTTMLFYQASAPSGWTKLTTQNNKALRVVSGSGGGTGGNNTFTSTFATRSVPLLRHNHTASSGNQSANHSHGVTVESGGSHTHGISDPGHNHDYSAPSGNKEFGNRSANAAASTRANFVSGNRLTGISINSGGSHNHGTSVGINNANHTHGITVDNEGTSGASMDFRVQYIDVIIASKDAYP
ncbi:tail fiber [Synechococcus phage S-B05]|jgi:hypothetical protein|nr:tail fiber [Synechococcus phage S-B05]